MSESEPKSSVRKTTRFVSPDEFLRGQKLKFCGRIWYVTGRREIDDRVYAFEYEAEEIR